MSADPGDGSGESEAAATPASPETPRAESTEAPAAPVDATAPPAPRVPSRLEIAERAVVTFFGARASGESAALFRIGFGLLAIWTSIGVWLNLERYYGNEGLVPWAIVKDDAYAKYVSLFALAPESHAMLVGHAIAFSAAAVLFTAGVFPRVAALVISYVNVSLQYRNPFILNSGDRLFQIVAALAVFMPLARRWSVTSALRRRLGKPDLPLGSDFGARLVQLEIAYVYISSFIAKVSNARWRSGIALRDVLASPVFAEWPAYLGRFPFVAFLTYMTLAFEIGFPLLVWFKKLRPWFLLWGVAFHAGIDALMIIPMFSMVMIVCYPAYLTDGEAVGLLRAVHSPRATFRRWRAARAEAKAKPPTATPPPETAPAQSAPPNV